MTLSTHSSSLPIRVRFAETDAMGVVYHARYFEYMEAARVALMDELGLPYSQLVKMGYHLPLIEVNACYRAPARFDDKLQVKATLHPLEGLRVVIDYKITRNKDLLVEGKTIHVFINAAGNPCRPPKEFVKFMEKVGH